MLKEMGHTNILSSLATVDMGKDQDLQDIQKSGASIPFLLHSSCGVHEH